MFPPNSLSMPSCNFRFWSWRDLDALGYTPLTPPCVFHNYGVIITVCGVVDSFLFLNPPKMGGLSILKEEVMMYCSLVFLALSAYISYIWDSPGINFSPMINCNYATIYINHWNWSSEICSSEKVKHFLRVWNHLPPINTSVPSVCSSISLISSKNIFSSYCNLSSRKLLKPSRISLPSIPCSHPKNF